MKTSKATTFSKSFSTRGKPETWSSGSPIFSYLAYEAEVTHAQETELHYHMMMAALQHELDRRLSDPAHLRDRKIKFIRDSDLLVWARVFSKPSKRPADATLHCTGTYCGVRPSVKCGFIFDAMDAVTG